MKQSEALKIALNAVNAASVECHGTATDDYEDIVITITIINVINKIKQAFERR